MTTINYKGKEFECLEHMREIKELDDDGIGIMKRFFNKKQMFSFFLGKFVYKDDDGKYVDDDDFYDDEEFGKASGSLTGYNDNGDFYITFYNLKDLNISAEELEKRMLWYGFFVKADNGEVYYVEMDID